MLLQLKGNPKIDNLRNYPEETVEKLNALLVAGAKVNPDPHRQDFYELENGCRTFYIHISPVTGRVWLLASWRKENCKEPTAAPTSPDKFAAV